MLEKADLLENNDRARKECMMSKNKVKSKKHRLFWHFFRIQLVLLVLVLTAAAY